MKPKIQSVPPLFPRPRRIFRLPLHGFRARGHIRLDGCQRLQFHYPTNWTKTTILTWTQWDYYRFGGTPTNPTSITISGYFGILSLTLQSGLTTYIFINSTNGQAGHHADRLYVNSGLALISIHTNSINFTINGDYIAGSAVTWDVGTARTLTLNGPLNYWSGNGAASLVKNGAGSAVLTQKSNYTGGTTVNRGTLLAYGDWMTGSLSAAAVVPILPSSSYPGPRFPCLLW